MAYDKITDLKLVEKKGYLVLEMRTNSKEGSFFLRHTSSINQWYQHIKVNINIYQLVQRRFLRENYQSKACPPDKNLPLYFQKYWNQKVSPIVQSTEDFWQSRLKNSRRSKSYNQSIYLGTSYKQLLDEKYNRDIDEVTQINGFYKSCIALGDERKGDLKN